MGVVCVELQESRIRARHPQPELRPVGEESRIALRGTSVDCIDRVLACEQGNTDTFGGEFRSITLIQAKAIKLHMSHSS